MTRLDRIEIRDKEGQIMGMIAQPQEVRSPQPPLTVWLPMRASPCDRRGDRPLAPHKWDQQTGLINEFNAPRFWNRRERKAHQRLKNNKMAASH